MGSSESSVPSYPMIKGTCTQLCSLPTERGVRFGWIQNISEGVKCSHGLGFEPRMTPVDAKITGGYSFGLSGNFDGITCSGILTAREGFNFDVAKFMAGVPIDYGCDMTLDLTFNENGAELGGDLTYESDIVNTYGKVMYISAIKSVSLAAHMSFSPMQNLYTGFMFGSVPALKSTQIDAGLLYSAGIAQLSLSAAKQIGMPGIDMTAGMSLFLDRGLVMNIMHERNGNGSETAVGLMAQFGKNTVISNISSNGTVASKFTRELTDDIKVSSMMQINMTPVLTGAISLGIDLVT